LLLWFVIWSPLSSIRSSWIARKLQLNWSKS
jgi:hypothetical protein